MVELFGPKTIELGKPFIVTFRSDTRVAGRLRLTAGKEALVFTLSRGGERPPETANTHRVRGREGQFHISDWGEHEVGNELVLRFEGAKLWMTVAEGPEATENG